MLYQEVRPQSLSSVFGNKSAKLALQRAIDADDKSHVFIFAGSTGCGKTTLARIMAKEFGVVDQMGLIEINAASQRGIDLARAIEKMAQASPLGGGSRAVIFDEVHMLTKEASNALLKVLEDVPEHTYYFLCTTEPNKIIKTIQTRAQRIDVSPLNDGDMEDMLADAIKRAELKDPGDKVIDAIIDNADGCPRSALVMLEQQDGMAEDDALLTIRSYKGQEKRLNELFGILLQKQWRPVVNLYNKLETKEPEAIRRYLLACLKNKLLKAKGKEADRFASMVEELTEPTYDSGEAGIVAMLYRACMIGR